MRGGRGRSPEEELRREIKVARQVGENWRARAAKLEEELKRARYELEHLRDTAAEDALNAANALQSEQSVHRATCARLAAAEKEIESYRRFALDTQRRFADLQSENSMLRAELARLMKFAPAEELRDAAEGER